MNCEYCQSKIFNEDRVCQRCGAPNIRKNKRDYTFGEIMMKIESEPIVEGFPGNQLMFTYRHTPRININYYEKQ